MEVVCTHPCVFKKTKLKRGPKLVLNFDSFGLFLWQRKKNPQEENTLGLLKQNTLLVFGVTIKGEVERNITQESSFVPLF